MNMCKTRGYGRKDIHAVRYYKLVFNTSKAVLNIWKVIKAKVVQVALLKNLFHLDWNLKS